MCLQQDLRDQGIDPEKLRALPTADDRNYHALQEGESRRDAGVRAVRLDGEQDRRRFSRPRARAGPTAYTAFIGRAAPAQYRDEFAR
jgi:hypothetical protein